MKKYEENARRLRLAMAEADITQTELSARTGINKSSLSQYMNGGHFPDDNRKVGLIAKVLNVNPAWLMGFNVPMHTDEEKTDAKSEQQNYYTDDTTAELAQAMASNPELKALFDVQRNMDTEDLKALYNMALALRRKEERLDSDDPA